MDYSSFPPGMLKAWETLLSRPENLVLDPATGVCEAVYRDPVLFPLQRRREHAAMLREAAAYEPQSVMEIGADKGGGLLHWCLLPTVRRVAACEVRGTPYRELFERAFPHVRFLWVEGPSLGAEKRVGEFLGGGGIDVLFIDGDKLGMEKDFDAYLPLLSSPGLVLMHDVSDDGPRQSYEAVRARRTHPGHEIIDVSEADEAVERQRRGIPPESSHERWLRHWRGASCRVGVFRVNGGPQPRFDRRAARTLLLDLADCLDGLGVPFFLIQGTCLGAVRDGGFVPSERDVDVGALAEDLAPRMGDLLRLLDGKGYEVETWHRRFPFAFTHTAVVYGRGAKADVVGYLKHGSERFSPTPADPVNVLEPYCLVHPAALLENTREVSLFGRAFRVPSPVEVYLEREYGPDWRTPREDHVSRSRVYGYLKKNGIP